MKINSRIKRFQEGGAMPAEAPQGQAPQGQGQDPLMMLAEQAQAAVQSQDGQLALEVCAGFLELIAQASGGGQEAPQQAPEGEPVYKRGGRLIKRI